MKRAFYSTLETHLSTLSVSRQSKHLITTETYNKVLQVLLKEKTYDSQFTLSTEKCCTLVKIASQLTIYCTKKLPIAKFENPFERLHRDCLINQFGSLHDQ